LLSLDYLINNAYAKLLFILHINNLSLTKTFNLNYLPMKNSKLTFKLLLILAAFISSVNFAYAWDNCASGPWVSFNFADGYTVYQNGWGSGDYQDQTLCVNSAGNWSSSGSFTGGGVKCYPHTQKDVNLPINSNSWCTANFNCSAPNNGTWYNFMFDCWTTNMEDELIISEMWNGDAIWGNIVAENVNIGGTSIREVRRAHNGANNVLIFTPYNKRSSGSENLMAYFQWSKDRGLLVNSSALFQVSWGVEITYTNGWQEFTCNSFSLNFGQNSGGGTSGNVSIQNRATGLYIDGMGRTSNGSNAGQWSGSSSNNQKWTMETSGSNVRFKNVATGLYLDGMGRSSNGSLVGQWGNSNSNNQKWTVETYGNYKRIKNVATGLYIDGMYWGSNGSNLGQWGGSGSDAQQWTITDLKSAESIKREMSGEGSDVVLYPNPFTYGISLSIADPEQVTGIEVFDMLGKRVEVIDRAAVMDLQVIGSSLKAGMYVVQIHGTDKMQSFKVLKK
jgi:hypothetical protein